MNIAIIGSGGREHSLCHKIAQSSLVNQIFCIPGNAGTKKIAINISTDLSDFDALYQIIKEQMIHYGNRQSIYIARIYNSSSNDF